MREPETVYVLLVTKTLPVVSWSEQRVVEMRHTIEVFPHSASFDRDLLVEVGRRLEASYPAGVIDSKVVPSVMLERGDFYERFGS